jgi:hypothetical protein
MAIATASGELIRSAPLCPPRTSLDVPCRSPMVSTIGVAYRRVDGADAAVRTAPAC